MQPELTIVSTPSEFAALAADWDDLVQTMRRPSPYLLHGWLEEWWRRNSGGRELAVIVSREGGRLTGALPLFVDRGRGTRTLRIIGEYRSMLADLLLSADADASVARGLFETALTLDFHYADLYGLPAGSRLEEAAGPGALRLIERAESPVLDLEPDWDRVLERRLSGHARANVRRRRRALAELGELEVSWVTTGPELELAIEESFRIHRLRWQGRPDVSTAGGSETQDFLSAAYRSVAARRAGIFRIALMTLGQRPIAYHAHFVLANRLYVHRLGFDPELARYGPGILLTHDVCAAACSEGLERVEFLGPAEPYKEPYTDRYEPIHEAIGLARTVRGRGLVAARLAVVTARRELRRRRWVQSRYVRARAAWQRARGGPGD